jgi:hypothetical protein
MVSVLVHSELHSVGAILEVEFRELEVDGGHNFGSHRFSMEGVGFHASAIVGGKLLQDNVGHGDDFVVKS